MIICCIQGYKIGHPSKYFLDRWMYYIDRISPIYRPRGFGQITCYEAFKELNDLLYWGIIPPNEYSLSGQGDCVLWGANKGSKDENLNRFKQDFKK